MSTIASTILRQLGGNRFIAMTGATCYTDNNTLIVKFKGSRAANIMYVTLNGLDLYDVKIAKYKGLDVKVVKEATDVYDDMLVAIFESATGLNTILH